MEENIDQFSNEALEEKLVGVNRVAKVVKAEESLGSQLLLSLEMEQARLVSEEGKPEKYLWLFKKH